MLASTIGVNQGCALSLMLFGLHNDEVVDYIIRGVGARIDLAGVTIYISYYAIC